MSGRTGSARLMASVSSVASNSLARLIPSPPESARTAPESARTASARSNVSFSSAEPAFFFLKQFKKFKKKFNKDHQKMMSMFRQTKKYPTKNDDRACESDRV
jgi:hypothetical protein